MKVTALACALALALLVVTPAAQAQPFKFKGSFSEPLTEAKQREAVDYKGFVFSFNNPGVAQDKTPNSRLISNQVAQNPFLATLPYGGNAQTLVKLGPCAGNNAHSHPRGSEISTLLYGNITFGMVEENAGKNKLINRNLLPLDTIHVPSGLIHFSHNNHCEPAAFLANFGNDDPGTQTTWNSFIQIPTSIIAAATGIPEKTIKKLKTYELTTPPATGGEACLKRCGLSFHKENKFEGLPYQG